MSELLAGRYEVVAELGRGGMGVVYRVADLQAAGQLVALKTIRADGPLTDDAMRRFEEEFRAMASLKHPNTLAVYDFGRLDASTRYLTMEIVVGKELKDVVYRDRQLAIPQAEALLGQLLQALAFIHARDYVHCDIKSRNILIRRDGVLKVMDFGLMTKSGTQLPAGTIAGTPEYLAPEVAQGEPLTPAADLYAVGCLAYEMLAGRLPFLGTLREVLRGHLQETPPPITSLRPDVPPRLAAAIDRMLAKRPEDRLSRAAEALELLDLAGRRAAPAEARRESYLVSGQLIGRDSQLTRLRDGLAGAAQGRGGAFLLSGLSGSGRTRLLDAIVLEAKLAGGQVFSARVTPDGGELGPLPDLAGASPATGADGVASALQARLLGATSLGPVLVAVDDADHLSGTAWRLLEACIRQDVPVLWLLATRSDRGDAAARLAATGAVEVLAVPPLDPAGTWDLVEAMLGLHQLPLAFGRTLYEATGGNVAAITDVVRHLLEERVLVQLDGTWRLLQVGPTLGLPDPLLARLANRLPTLSPLARELAEAAAVVGRNVEVDLLVEVAGLAPEPLAGAMAELLRLGVLEPEGDGYAFPADGPREAYERALPPKRRAELHGRAARHLEQHGGKRPPVARLAHHYQASGDRRKAHRWLRRAGDLAVRAGNLAEACRCWREAELVAPGGGKSGDGTAKRDLAWTIGVAGREAAPAAAASALERLLRDLTALGDPEGEAKREARLVRRTAWLPAGWREALRRGIQSAPAFPPPDAARRRRPPPGWLPRVVEVLARQAWAQGRAGNPARGLDALHRASGLISLPVAGLEGLLAHARCAVLASAGQLDDLRAALDGLPADPGPKVDGLPALPVRLDRWRGTVAFQGEQPVEPAPGQDPDPLMLAIWQVNTGRGDEAEALLEAEQARSGDPEWTAWQPYLRAQLMRLAGHLDLALGLAERGIALLAGGDERFAHLHLLLLKADLLVDLDQLSAAEDAYKELEVRARKAGTRLVALQAKLGLGLVAGRGRRPDLALKPLTDVEGQTARGPTRNPLLRGRAMRLLGEVALASGKADQALRWAQAALAVAEQPEQGNRIEQARCHRLLAAVHRANQDEAEARASEDAAEALTTWAAPTAPAASEGWVEGGFDAPAPAFEGFVPVGSTAGPAFESFAPAASAAFPAFESFAPAPSGAGAFESFATDAVGSSSFEAFPATGALDDGLRARLAAAIADRPGSDLAGALLEACLDAGPGADRAYLFEGDPARQLAGRASTAEVPPYPLDPQLLAQARAEGGLVTIDMPMESASTGSSVIGDGVVALLVVVAGPAALLLVRQDVSAPYGDADLLAFQACADLILVAARASG